MADLVRVQVLFLRKEADRFTAYCREMGFKKSTLIARLVREHLDKESFNPQQELFSGEMQEPKEL